MSSREASVLLQSAVATVVQWDADALVTVRVTVRRIERKALRRLMRALTRAGDTTGWLVHCFVLLALLRIELRSIEVMAVAAVIATVASQLAKRSFRRARPAVSIPDFVASEVVPDPWSFPSGHSTVAFAVATAAVATTPLLGVFETVLAISIACSRVGLGAHYPVDVIAGMLLGFCCGMAAWALPL